MRLPSGHMAIAETEPVARPCVLLLTAAFPFRPDEDTFLPQEVAYLAEQVDLVIAPCDVRQGPEFPLPAGAQRTTGLARALGSGGLPLTRLPAALVSSRLWSEVRRTGSWPWRLLAFATILVWTARSLAVAAWVGRWCDATDRPVSALYTWWANPAAVGAIWAGRPRGIPVISRAHGADLYPEQSRIGFIAYQSTVVNGCAAVLPDGERGVRHLNQAHPGAAADITVSHLGTTDPGFLAEPSADGELRVVSCSGVIPVKRLDLMLAAMALLAASPGRHAFHWTHIGDGPGLDRLREEIDGTGNLASRVTLTGRLPPGGVFAYYRDHPVDLFVNVSSSEGLPVAMMEAASCGIALLGTDVGGIRDLVEPAGGLLLPADVAAADLASALDRYGGMSAVARRELGRQARQAWAERFDAARVYPAFATILLGYCRSPAER